MSLPERKRMRLNGYDYSTPGCYFVTICTHNWNYIFGDGENLSECGVIVDEEIKKIPAHYSDIKIDNYVVMPNHVHILLTIGCDALPNNEKTIFNEVLGKSEHQKLDKVVGLFKAGVTRRIHRRIPDLKIWQKSYYDHIIKNEKDYNETWDYIDANPIRWKIKYGYVDVNEF